MNNNNYSNNLNIDKEKCIFCGACAEKCILDNIRLQVAPCRVACPLDQNCQGYIQLVKRKDLIKAASFLWDNAPLQQVLGYACSAHCQTACTLGKKHAKGVAIRALKRLITDTTVRPKPSPGSGNRKGVGIIGSGPAGLTAAWELRRHGWAVTIYEQAKEPGGHLSQTIPDYRLPKKVVADEISWIKSWGVEIITSIKVGNDISMSSLQKKHDAILLAAGAYKPISLRIPGEESINVHQGLSLLQKNKKGQQQPLGPRVIVFGAGNSAFDAALCAKRLGADDVMIITRRIAETELAAGAEAIEQAQEEGISIEYGLAPSEFLVQEGRAKMVRFERCIKSCDGNILFTKGLEYKITSEADDFIVAIGDRPDVGLLESEGLRLTPDSDINPFGNGIFASGDFLTGPSSIAWAMASGKRAARSIDLYLRDQNPSYNRIGSGSHLTEKREFNFEDPDERIEPNRQPIKARKGFQLIEETFSEEQALRESERCLSCGGPVACFDSCWYCLPCEESCPEQALTVKIPYKIR